MRAPRPLLVIESAYAAAVQVQRGRGRHAVHVNHIPACAVIREIDDDVYAGLRRRAAEAGLSVPELRGNLNATAARQAVEDLRTWSGTRVGHQPFLDRAWELHQSISPADPLYVGLAEALDAPLLTLDRRLARSDGPHCEIRVPL